MISAAVLRERGTPLEIVELDADQPRSGEVRVSVRASGVCHSDLSVLNGSLGEGHPTPCVLGHEAAGVVSEVGPQVTGLREGDHVVFAWVTPCGRCRTCLANQPNLCLG